MEQRWAERQRPLSPEIAWAQAHYAAVQVVDGSTLDALLRRIGLLQELPQNPLAGRMTAVLNLASRLPTHVWYEADPKAHDQRFWERILTVLQAQTLLIFDLGYTNFAVFAQLTCAHVTFITRAKKNLSYTVERPLVRSGAVHETLVWVGPPEQRQILRLVEVRYR